MEEAIDLYPTDYCLITLSGGAHKFDFGGDPGGNNCYEYEQQNTDIYSRVAMRMKISGSASTQYAAMALGSCTTPPCAFPWFYAWRDELEVKTDKKLEAWTWTGGGYEVEASSQSLAADTWYDVVVQACSASAPDGWMTVDVDGVRWIAITGQDTSAYRPNEQLMIGRMIGGAGEDDIYFDTVTWTWLPIGPVN